MVAGLLAAIAAFLAALFSLADPGPGPEMGRLEPVPSAEDSPKLSLEESIDELRSSIRAFVDAQVAAAKQTAEDARADAAARTEAVTESSSSTDAPGSITAQIAPSQDAPSGADATSGEDDGCETKQESGDGWIRTFVRCVQESTSQSSSSSSSQSSSSSVSSSVNVQVTSSDDVP